MAGQPLPRISGVGTVEELTEKLNAALEQIDERMASTEQGSGKTPYIPREGTAQTALPEDLATATLADVTNVLNTLIGDLKTHGRLT